MHQVLIREIEDMVYSQLKLRARKNGRSFEAELRLILKDEAVEEERITNRLEEARKIRNLFKGRVFSDSAQMIRADRDQR